MCGCLSLDLSVSWFSPHCASPKSASLPTSLGWGTQVRSGRLGGGAPGTPAPYPSRESGLFIFPSLPPRPQLLPPPSLLLAAAAAVRCQGNHSWLGGSPLHPIPPLLSGEAGRSWDKARERRGARGGRWREREVGPAPAVNLGQFSLNKAPISPSWRCPPVQPGERGSRGQRGQAQFNTQNKLIHSRGRQ